MHIFTSCDPDGHFELHVQYTSSCIQSFSEQVYSHTDLESLRALGFSISIPSSCPSGHAISASDLPIQLALNLADGLHVDRLALSAVVLGRLLVPQSLEPVQDGLTNAARADESG